MRSKYITMSHDMLGYKNQNTSRSAWKSNVDNAVSEKVSCFCYLWFVYIQDLALKSAF